MAGLPELNGVFGTFGGMSGLDITPLLAKQRGRMFQQQLAQEAAKMAQQQQLATRGLDLQQRGQDLGVTENDLARKFAENLNNMRQQFDATEAEKQRAAVAAQQQRAIQEAQRAQSSGQEFQGQQAEAQRGFAGEQAQQSREFQREESAMDRALKAEALQFDKDRFEKTFAMESERFNFTKDITLKDQGRQDRADELKQQMFELQKQEFGSQAEQRSAQTKLINMQVELYGQQLADAREDAGLTDDELSNIIESASNGDVASLDGSVLKKLSTNKKAREAVFGLMELVKSGQEIGLVKQATQKAAEKTPEEQAAAGLTPEETGLKRRLLRAQEQDEIGDVGMSQAKALTELEGLGAATDPDAVDRREKLRAFIALTQGMEGEDISDMSPDGWDAALGILGPITLGATWQALVVKKGIQGLSRMSEDEKTVAIREMADELGLSE